MINMKHLHYILACSILAMASCFAVESISPELLLFGTSYHSNRNVRWNEKNPGVGVGVAYAYDEDTDLVFSVGTYKDSFAETARFALVGARAWFGDRNAGHMTVGFHGGYYEGSGFAGAGFMPVVSVGYEWLDLCITGMPSGSTSGHTNTGPNDPHNVATGFVGVFVQVRLMTF